MIFYLTDPRSSLEQAWFLMLPSNLAYISHITLLLNSIVNSSVLVGNGVQNCPAQPYRTHGTMEEWQLGQVMQYTEMMMGPDNWTFPLR